jgi:hypothetical protein
MLIGEPAIVDWRGLIAEVGKVDVAGKKAVEAFDHGNGPQENDSVQHQ